MILYKQWHLSFIFHYEEEDYTGLLFRQLNLSVGCLEHDVMAKEGFPGVSVVENLPANIAYVRDAGSVPGSGRSPGEGNGNPVQYSCPGNPMDEGT